MDDWKDIAKDVARIGLPVLGTALGGPAGAAVGQLLASVIGADTADPTSIVQKLAGDANALQKAREFEATNSRLLLEMHLEALTKSDAGQVQINSIEAASGSLWKSGWRPYIGWTCGLGLSYTFLFRPIIGWVALNGWGWTLPPELDIAALLSLVMGMLGLGAYRTIERLNGKVKASE